MKRILIAVPTFENILPDTFKSIYNLEIPENYICDFDFIKGYDCARARNEIAKKALENNYDYILMVDSDTIIPKDALINMLYDPKEMCLGIYPRKNTSTGQTECFKLGQKDYIDVYHYEDIDKFTDNYIEIKGGGLGCALIDTKVFNNIKFPYFKYVIYDSGAVLSEDNYFCSQLTAANYKIFMNTNVRCGHSIRKFQWR